MPAYRLAHAGPRVMHCLPYCSRLKGRARHVEVAINGWCDGGVVREKRPSIRESRRAVVWGDKPTVLANHLGVSSYRNESVAERLSR